jgi:adenosylmethionine-8-amino-7-oxononanoate aminotransferase
VAEVRQCGMIVAAEFARDGNPATPFDWRERRGLRVYRHALEHEMLLRPLGNVVYFMPPYVITPDQIDRMVEVARDGILTATDDCSPATVAGSNVPAASAAGLEF